MGDLFTDILFNDGSRVALVFPVSRVVLDPERFRRDQDEPMAKIGMGAIYTVTHELQPLRKRLSQRQREALLSRYYDPHHQKLARLTAESLRQYGKALIIDCHSFPKNRLPYERASKHDRPEICIGSDPYHTPERIETVALLHFLKQGFTVALNQPFAESIVPSQYFRKEASVISIMIEIRRDLYMDEGTKNLIPRHKEIQKSIQTLMRKLEKEAAK
jgi:N-formylglutamate deformylase